MIILKIILNLPWSLLLFIYGLLSVPTKVQFSQAPPAVILSVRSFWWARFAPGKKGTRALATGNVILLGPRLLAHDLEHELIHAEQAMRRPFIHPLLYALESLQHGPGPRNRYEREAYTRAGNEYKEK